MPILSVDKVSSGYGQLSILKEVSLTVEPSEIVIIVGPNGAGKSTLLKTVFGLLNPTTGDIRFEGNSILGLRPSALVKAGMAFVPQVDNVFPSLTILENLRVVEGAAKGAVDRVMDLFPVLRLRRDAKAGTLSGGERQFLAIGRALMLEPRLVLLDEPSAGLSPKMTTELFDYCSTLAKSGISFLMIEQNVLPALQICDRGYVLVAGRNKLEGSGRDILENPDMRTIFLGGAHA